jgi:DNA-binding NarL/FixJ family response regulator
MTTATPIVNPADGTGARRNIFIVEDNAMLRSALSSLLERESDFCVCGGAESIYEALAQIEQHAPDAAIVDLSLRGSSGMDLIRTLREQYPRMRLLVLSMHDEKLLGDAARSAGANAYIMKHQASDKLLDELRRCLAEG